jgi:hypothetical protein
MTQSTHSRGDVLMFVHIPKAAGMTLYRIIERQYSSRAVFFIDGQRVAEDAQRFLALSEAERGRYRCIVGHLHYGLHEYLTTPMRYITILREPLDRLVSHYYYAKSTPTNRLHGWIKSENVDLEKYVLEGLPANGQTRMICGFTRENRLRYEDPNVDILGLAKANLRERFAAFGLAERFDESMLLFQKALGWRNVYYVKVNVTGDRPARDQVSPPVRKAIESYCALDFELYEYARTLYETHG